MDKERIKGLIKTKTAPRVQDAHPSYMESLPPAKDKMSLDEFMRRNPSARTRDKVKKAQERQGKRGPKMRETERSLRNKHTKTQIRVSGDLIDYFEPKKD